MALKKKQLAGPYGQTAIIIFLLLLFLLTVFGIGIALSLLEEPPPAAHTVLPKKQAACYSINFAVS
jgi:hypothetical protein